jgi:hypothetical protein
VGDPQRVGRVGLVDQGGVGREEFVDQGGVGREKVEVQGGVGREEFVDQGGVGREEFVGIPAIPQGKPGGTSGCLSRRLRFLDPHGRASHPLVGLFERAIGVLSQ